MRGLGLVESGVVWRVVAGLGLEPCGVGRRCITPGVLSLLSVSLLSEPLILEGCGLRGVAQVDALA